MFIALDEAFDHIPKQEVWSCLRGQGVPKKYVNLLKDTYDDARTQVKTIIGVTGTITVRVGLHQGSSLIPYLFEMILDVTSCCVYSLTRVDLDSHKRSEV